MSFDLEMTLSRKERAFERVVGLVGRRGYEIVGASATLLDGGRSMAVRLTLEANAPRSFSQRSSESFKKSKTSVLTRDRRGSRAR